MKTATGLALVAVGAILAFAVTGHPSFLNVQVAGWVIMLTGVAGMLGPGGATDGCAGALSAARSAVMDRRIAMGSTSRPTSC